MQIWDIFFSDDFLPLKINLNYTMFDVWQQKNSNSVIKNIFKIMQLLLKYSIPPGLVNLMVT